MKISGILKPLKDVRPVTELIRTLDMLSSSCQEPKATVLPSGNAKDAVNSSDEIIADLRLTNKLLYYQVSKIETVLNNLNDGIMLLDSSNRVFAINHIMEQIVNLKRGDIKGKHIKECQNNNEILSFVLENTESADKLVEKTIELNTGSSSLRVSFKTLIRDDGNTGGSLLVAKDVTAHKLADNAKVEFLSYLSGEITTPLNLIRSYSARLHDDNNNFRELTDEFLRNLEGEAARLSVLVNNVLRLSKIEMGELVISRTMTRTRDFIENVFNKAVAESNKKIITGTQIPEDLTPVSIDKELIGLAIESVLSNAIKYTPENGAVRLRAEEDSENVLIHIIDTGIGISEDDITHIFEKFYRSSDEMVRKHRGDGLGLSIARQIVELHEGEIRVSSKKGEGSHFTIVLPVGQGYLLG
ncbi:MAG: hypothetical protein IT393_02580 [Nitrospirae bacterium]|nr:hypothetical protein [Nitrospirota bacterium]